MAGLWPTQWLRINSAACVNQAPRACPGNAAGPTLLADRGTGRTLPSPRSSDTALASPGTNSSSTSPSFGFAFSSFAKPAGVRRQLAEGWPDRSCGRERHCGKRRVERAFAVAGGWSRGRAGRRSAGRRPGCRCSASGLAPTSIIRASALRRIRAELTRPCPRASLSTSTTASANHRPDRSSGRSCSWSNLLVAFGTADS